MADAHCTTTRRELLGTAAAVLAVPASAALAAAAATNAPAINGAAWRDRVSSFDVVHAEFAAARNEVVENHGFGFEDLYLSKTERLKTAAVGLIELEAANYAAAVERAERIARVPGWAEDALGYLIDDVKRLEVGQSNSGS